MVIPRSLLFKGLGLCSLCGGVGVAIHQKDNIASLLSSNSSSKITRGNLECEEPTQQGGNCVLKTGEKIFVKKGNDTPFELTSLGDGKIKVYKVEGAGGDDSYSDGFKFLIEDNDIASGDKKLEEFETYEIKLGDEGETDVNLKGQHYLLQKTDVKEEIKKALGLPWDLPDSSSQDHENINTDNLKNIKFDGRTGATISGGTVTLTISKESSKNEFPLGYKFTFKNSGNSEATLTFGGTPISLKKGSDVDFKIKKEGSSLSLEKAWTVETLAEKVGLKKENDDYWTVGEKGLNVKQNTIKELKKAKDSSNGKIKVYKEQDGYNEGLKFTIEEGDVNLRNGDSSSIILGQFQSYEIVKDSDGNWYFSKKEGDQARIKELLNLPCDLPTDSETQKDCSLNNDNIKAIKFDGVGEGTVTSTGQPKLTIHKESGRLDYPLGYKFVFTSASGDSTLTIGSTSIKLKEGVDVEFRIKISEENKESLSLEKAFTADSLVDLVSLKKNGDAWVVSDGGTSIKQNGNKSSNATVKGNNGAKIRLYDGTPGYNQGMKFVVEEGNTSLDGDNGISQLSKYETYEITKEDDGYWYFSRKKTTTEAIKDILGLPQDCTMPNSSTLETTCSLNSAEKLKAIKFEGKGDAESVTVDSDDYSKVKMKISKTSDNHFTHGYKFILESEKDVTIPQNGGTSIAIKKNTNTEFKIKEQGNKLTLERAWNGSSLGAKINLKECNQEKKCSFGDNINVFDSDNSYVDDATTSSSQKITYEENVDGYNQGIKFYVENDVTLEGGTEPSGSEKTKVTTICKKDGNGGSTYQIMEKSVEGNKKWYLVKKTG